MAPYRDEREAIADRMTRARAELTRIDADLAKTQSLLARRGVLERQLERLTERKRRSLPLLASLRVEAPCREAWDAMEGSDRKRWCGRCHEPVYDLGAFTDEEAEALLAQPSAPCVRFARRFDGTVTTGSCKRPALRASPVELALTLGGIAVAAVAAGALALVETTTMGRAYPNQHAPTRRPFAPRCSSISAKSPAPPAQ